MSNTENLKKDLENLEETVKVVQEKELRIEAFKKLLELSFGRPKQEPSGISNDIETDSQDIVNISDNLVALCKELEVTEDQIRSKFDFQDNSVRMFEAPNEKTRVKIQVKALTILALLMKRVYSEKTINAGDILNKSRLPSERIDNLSKNENFKKIFSGSSSRALTLTWVGEKEAKELLKEYIINENK